MPNSAYRRRCTSTWMGLRCRIWWDVGHTLHRWWNEWDRVQWHDQVADPPVDPFPMHEAGRE